MLDYNFLAWVTSLFGSTMPDFKRQRTDAEAKLAQQMAAGGQ